MKIKSIKAQNVPPVKKFEVDNLSDRVVIAGANGVGKTRLINAIVNSLRVGDIAQVVFEVQATNSEERSEWGKDILDTTNHEDRDKLATTLQKRRNRSNTKSTVMLFESNRGFQKINPLQFQFRFDDPDSEEIAWDMAFRGYNHRAQDTFHSILKKVQGEKNKIADRAQALMEGGTQVMDLSAFTDPLKLFKDAFASLLAPKKLVEANLEDQKIYFEHQGQRLPLESLSSGEKEVVNIVFDFILRNPKDAIVIFDEPEVHLHPELVQKLVQTLTGIGERNQFIFCTHSPHIIANSMENTVVCIAYPEDANANQAKVIKDDDETQQVLKTLGQSIGVITLGNKIVFIEGENASLDKDVYLSITKERFPKIVLVPSGGKSNLVNFGQVIEQLLNKSIWGVDFFILSDQDASPIGSMQNKVFSANEKFRCLNKYHLENYFLDAGVIVKVFEDMCGDDEWLRDISKVEQKLREIGQRLLPFAVNLRATNRLRFDIGNVDVSAKGCDKLSKDDLTAAIQAKGATELIRVSNELDPASIQKVVHEEYDLLHAKLAAGDEWKSLIPGRSVLKIFCGEAKIDFARYKRAYLIKAQAAPVNPFSEIIDIFEDFSKMQ